MIKVEEASVYGHKGYIVVHEKKGVFGYIDNGITPKTKEPYLNIKLQQCYRDERGTRLQWRKIGAKSKEWGKVIPFIAMAAPELARGVRDLIDRLLKDLAGEGGQEKEVEEIKEEEDKIDELMRKIGGRL